METKIVAIVWPKKKKIACPLLQAVFGCSSHIPGMFDIKFWELDANFKGARALRGTKQEWQKVAEAWNGSTRSKRC